METVVLSQASRRAWRPRRGGSGALVEVLDEGEGRWAVAHHEVAAGDREGAGVACADPEGDLEGREVSAHQGVGPAAGARTVVEERPAAGAGEAERRQVGCAVVVEVGALPQPG